MRYLLFLLFLLPLTSAAEIFKCGDSSGKITYQSTPCQTKSLGKIKRGSQPTEEDVEKSKAEMEALMQKQRAAAAQAEIRRQELIKYQEQQEYQKNLEAQMRAEQARRNLERLQAEERARETQELLRRQTEAAERAANAAERSRNRPVRCYPNYGGSIDCY